MDHHSVQEGQQSEQGAQIQQYAPPTSPTLASPSPLLPLSPNPDHKHFNSKCITVTKAKLEEEHEADLKHLAGLEVRLTARSAAQQACLQCQADKRAVNATAMAEYKRSTLLLAQNFPKHP